MEKLKRSSKPRFRTGARRQDKKNQRIVRQMVKLYGRIVFAPFANIGDQGLTNAPTHVNACMHGAVANLHQPEKGRTSMHHSASRQGALVRRDLLGELRQNARYPEKLADFKMAVKQYELAYIAESTRKRHLSQWFKICGLCAPRGLCPVPMDVDTAVGIVSHIASVTNSYPQVRSVRATISFVHEFVGIPSPTNHPKFLRVIRGIGRTLGVDARHRKLALWRAEVAQMIHLALRDGRPDLAFALAFGFESALRAGNLLAVRVEDVTVSPDGGLIVWVPKSKTDQAGKGASIKIPKRTDQGFDVCAMTQAWLRRLGRSTGPLVVPLDGDGKPSATPSDQRTWLRTVKDYATLIGCEPDEIGTHSLRAGYATEELDRGRSAALVAAHLLHKNLDSLLTYYRPRRRVRNVVVYASSGIDQPTSTADALANIPLKPVGDERIQFLKEWVWATRRAQQALETPDQAWFTDFLIEQRTRYGAPFARRYAAVLSYYFTACGSPDLTLKPSVQAVLGAGDADRNAGAGQ